MHAHFAKTPESFGRFNSQGLFLTGKVWVIINPVAGRGAASALAPRAVSSFRSLGAEFSTTAGQGDEARLTQQALARGATTIVAVGGDGTCARIADEILKSRSQCALGFIPCGTGNDFAKMLGVTGYGPEKLVGLLASGVRSRIDVGLADGHYFLNSCGFGFDASVLEASQKIRFIKGDAVYIYSALAQLFSYPGIDMSVDGALRMRNGKMLMAIASNGRSLGGAFRIAPSASVTDGKLDFCLFADNNVLGRVRIFAGALRGTHLTLPGVISVRTDTLSLTFAENPAMEMDGELRQATSRTVRIECVAKALAVIAGPGGPV